MKKVLLITNMITPYRIPLYNYIAKDDDFNFNVIALSEKEKNRKWQIDKSKINFNYQILSGCHFFFSIKKREMPVHLNKGVFSMLIRSKPDVVVTTGYDSLAYWQAFLYCKIFRKKFILCNGTTLLSVGSIKGWRGLLKKIIIQGANKCIAYGTKAKEYLEYFGAKSEDIYISTNTVDIEFFYQEVNKYRKREGFFEERRKYPPVLFLYVGQLIQRKGVKQILKALSRLKDGNIGLMIIGSGPQEKELKEFTKENKLENVYFEGFRQQEELPKYYALADVLIFPSFQEVWGLVVNEALASGLYVLCSKYAGSGYDLLDRERGKMFDPDNIDELCNYINEVKMNISKIKTSRKKISNWAVENLGIEKSGRQFILAIKSSE